jgi:glycosyltransferase involved in cell wall biosynthesis
MSDRNLSFLVISDYHPSELKGAASEALNSAKIISAQLSSSVIFLSSGGSYGSFNDDSLQCYQLPRFWFHNLIADRTNRSVLARIVACLFRHLYLIRAIPFMARNRKSTFILNSIGKFFPFSLLLVLKFLRARVFLIHHDFSVLQRNKLYPNHFLEQDTILAGRDIVEKRISLKLANFSFRRSLLRLLCNSFSTQVALSGLQKYILQENGFDCRVAIAQTINQCSCTNFKKLPRKVPRLSIRILFVGRGIGKGFEELVSLVKSSSSLHLTVVGPNYLLETLQRELPSGKFLFLGELEPRMVFLTMHASDLVWARSTYFDVGPLTVLEALAHGVPVACTPLTGNSIHANKVMSSLVAPQNCKVTEEDIALIVQEWDRLKKRIIAMEYVRGLGSRNIVSMIKNWKDF